MTGKRFVPTGILEKDLKEYHGMEGVIGDVKAEDNEKIVVVFKGEEFSLQVPIYKDELAYMGSII